FSQRSAIFLRPEAQFDTLVGLKDSADRAQAIIAAMNSIEADYATLRGSLPKAEYQEVDNAVLGDLLRALNPEELKRVGGDVFGRIYEYFLTQFADQKAHDGGEFFTPVALVQTIVNFIEPDHGIVLDPACGSAGMFVQSAHLVEARHRNPSEALTFYGLEKNPTTIRLAKRLGANPLRTDFQKHYEAIVEAYNKEKDRATIEQTFQDLMLYQKQLDEESTRAIREGLDEESLALFDILRKPDLDKNTIAQLKQVAGSLLETLKAEKLKIDHWRDKEATRDAVQIVIKNFLWNDQTGLPVESYTEEDVEEKSEEVFRHVWRAYPYLPSPVYAV
ncbi:MAG: DUF3387 domain-containing protein, partial [Gammaproteobacteria bacterium]|nr:DUF3387 domain-containing protein [Gammaproteobacteria bacterium]